MVVTVNSLKLKEKTRIACWDVRTLHQTGKLAQVVREFENCGLDILGTCEAHWTGSGQRTFAFGHTIVGGHRGCETPASRSFTPASHPLLQGFPPLCSISIVKCYTIMQKIFSFSPGSRHFGNPASCPFSPCLLTPTAPYSPGLLPSVPLHTILYSGRLDGQQREWP